MKIHDSKAAPNPRRVRIFVAEKGLDVPFEEVDIANAINRQSEFRQKNPMGTVPVLELDDGTCIAESAAICRYFEEMHPQPPLLGVDAKDRAVVAMWDRRMEFELLLPIADSFRQHHPFFKGRIEQCPEYAEVAKRRAVQNLAWLDEALADRRFVAGERFTVADITALCSVDFGRVSKISIAPEQKNLARWHEEVSARPSAKA
jgi:glutathione S-transferase